MILDEKKNLLVLGCSFTVSEYKTFGEFISEKYDMNLHNLGIEGGSNFYIQKKLIQFFAKNKNNSLFDDTFVIIGWSHPQRRLYWNNNKKDWFNDTNHINMKETDRFKEPFIHKTWAYKDRQNFATNFLNSSFSENSHYMEHIISTQSFMELNKIPYIMFNSLWDMFSKGGMYQTNMAIDIDENESNPPNFGQPTINRVVWANLVNENKFFEKVFVDMIGDDKSLWYSEQDSHPNEKAHKLWSDKLVKFIGDTYV